MIILTSRMNTSLTTFGARVRDDLCFSFLHLNGVFKSSAISCATYGFKETKFRGHHAQAMKKLHRGIPHNIITSRVLKKKYELRIFPRRHEEKKEGRMLLCKITKYSWHLDDTLNQSCRTRFVSFDVFDVSTFRSADHAGRSRILTDCERSLRENGKISKCACSSRLSSRGKSSAFDPTAMCTAVSRLAVSIALELFGQSVWIMACVLEWGNEWR